jgi:hypothetical protein
MRNRLSELVSLQILRKLELRDVLALRVASRTLNAIVSRMFPQVFPKRRICLNDTLLRETGKNSIIPKPPRYDERSFDNWKKAPPWREWDGSGGIYNPAGWCRMLPSRLTKSRPW